MIKQTFIHLFISVFIFGMILQNIMNSSERSQSQIVNNSSYNNQQNDNNNQVEEESQSLHNQHSKTNPFLIESYNREERQKERMNKPKLGLKRLTDDKKLVSIDLDIPLDQNTVIKDRFDWDLSKDKISPTDFAKELVLCLNLPKECSEKISEQIISQIMEHIKDHTRQKVQEEREILNEQINRNNLNNIRFGYNNDYQQDDIEKEENEKKKMSRMRRNDMKRTTTYIPTQPNRYFKQKKVCRNCKNENNAPGYECKNCKLPFELMQVLNFDDKRVKISAKYYEKIANKIPLLTYEAKKKSFEKQDFDSFYAIYNKIKGIFETSDQLSKQNLNQVKYIMQKYHEYFLNGNLEFNDEEIIYDKDIRKQNKKQEDANRPKRARGRPRKIKILNEDLVPNSNQNSMEESSESDSEDDSSSSS